MSSSASINEIFQQVKSNQTLWALQDSATQGWVVVDSESFENTDLMPLWSDPSLAKQHCVDDWSNYEVSEIPLAEWLEYWVEDLAEDGVMIGLNWPLSGEQNSEMKLAEFSQQLAQIESY
ncbi:DUF2750 domain-containing protein [Paraglaciecola aestuariivivens]